MWRCVGPRDKTQEEEVSGVTRGVVDLTAVANNPKTKLSSDVSGAVPP